MSRLKTLLNKFLLKKYYRKFWVQLAFGFIIIFSIVTALLGFLLINTSRATVRNYILNKHKDIISRGAKEINLFLKSPIDLLSSSAAIVGTIHSTPWQQETILVELALNQPILMSVSHFDLSGNIIATSDLGAGRALTYEKKASRLISRGKSYFSDVKFRNDGTPYLSVIVPVKVKGLIKSALSADINLRGLWEIVDNIRLDNTGRAFLVSNNGIIIAHPDKKLVLKNEDLKTDKDVSAVIRGKSEAVEITGSDGKEWVSSYTSISGTGWGIVLRQERQEAYFRSRIMQSQSWIIIILSEILAVLVSIVTARAFADPIRVLISGIKSSGGGRQEEKIKIKRYDEIGELIEVFNELTDKLKKAKANEKFSDIGQAALWVAHELKNSLVSIKSFVQLFPVRHNDREFVDKFSILMPEEINRLEGMLKELSDFSQYRDLNIEKVNVKEIIDSVLKIMEDKFIDNKIKVQYYVKNHNLKIAADAKRLRQVFLNLVINAVNAMPDGGELTVTLDLEMLSGARFVTVTISDTGVGIEPDRLKNIFEPFRPQTAGRTSLGLAISKRIINQHKGDIQAESSVGFGSNFTLKLPVEEGAGIKSRIRTA